MKVIVVGLPLFSKRFVEDINQFSNTKELVFIDTYSSKFELLKFLILLPFVDGVLSINGVTDNSGTLNYVLRWKKKLWMQWVGTDVLLASERFAKDELLRKYIDYAYNVTDAKWLKEELAQANIEADENSYKFLDRPTVNLKKYDSIKVLSYVAKNRENFYGLNHIVKLAESNPEITFNIVGTDSYHEKLPSNIILHGWVSHEEMYKMMSEHAIFIRLTDHDGYSASVIESMSLGCEVIASHPFENAYVPNEENLIDKFQFVIEKIRDRGLLPNAENSNLYLKKFHKETVLKDLYHQLKKFYE